MIFKQLQIELPTITKKDVDDAIERLESLRLETQIGFDLETFNFNNIELNPELVQFSELGKRKQMILQRTVDGEVLDEFPYCEMSFFLFHKEGSLRRKLYKLGKSPETTWLIRLVILVNTLSFCLYDYSFRQTHEKSTLNSTTAGLEIMCNVIFGIEILIWSIAQGLVTEPRTYLRNFWNVLNLITFISTWSVLSDNQSDFMIIVLRVLRLFRIFRIIQENPFLKEQTDLFFQSFGSLGPILVPCVSAIFFFSVVGLHLLNGLTQYRCRDTPEPVGGVWNYDKEIKNLCGSWVCPEQKYCGAPSQYGLHYDKNELKYPEFFYGYNTFDNIFYSTLSSFLFFVGMSWTDTIFIYWKTINKYVCASYFVIMIFFLEYILSDLLLVALYESFEVHSHIKQHPHHQHIEHTPHVKQDHQTKHQTSTDASPKKKKLSTIQNLRTLDSKFIRKQSMNALSLVIRRKSAQGGSGIIDLSLNNVKKYSGMIVSSQQFKFIVTIAIMGNALVLCCDYHGIPQQTLANLQIADFVFTLIFIVEILLKLWAKGLRNYANKIQNKFDLIIVLVQIGVIIYQFIMNQSIFYVQGKTINVLKVTKILRLIKFLYIAVIMRTISILTRCYLITLNKIWVLVILLLLQTFAVAIFGQEFFSHNYVNSSSQHRRMLSGGSYPPFHFDDLGNSLMSVLNIYYKQEWNLWMDMFATQRPVSSLLFFIIADIILQVFYLRLVQAVFINEFGKQWVKLQGQITPVDYENYIQKIKSFFISRRVHPRSSELDQSRSIGMEMQSSLTSKITPNISVSQTGRFNNEVENEHLVRAIEPKTEELRTQRTPRNSSSILKKTLRDIKEEDSKPTQQTNKLKRYMKIVVESRYYRIGMLVVVLVTAMKCVLLNPLLDPKSQEKQTLDNIFYVLLFLYILEIIMNWISFGLIISPQSYLRRSNWNVVSFTITFVNLIQLITGSDNVFLNFIDSLRVLVFIKLGAEQNRSIRYAQKALVKVFITMIQLTIFSSILLLVYGVFAVKLLKGSLYYCTAFTVETGLIKNKYDCFDYGGSWVNQSMTFDHIFDAMNTLLFVASSQGWLILMEQSWAAIGVDQQPQENHNRWWGIFFYIFFFLGNVCMINMFQALIVSTYQESKEEAQNLHLLTEHQREWFKIKLTIHQLQPLKEFIPPNHPIRLIAYQLTNQKYLRHIWLSCIAIAIINLSMQYSGENDEYSNTQEIIKIIMQVVQLIEIIIRLLAYGKECLNDDLNVWDIFCILVMFINSIFCSGNTCDMTTNRVMDATAAAAQIIRGYRIIRLSQELEKLFHSIFSVLPNAVSMLYIMIIILYLYTIIGMDLFAYLRLQSAIDGYDLSFQDFFSSMFSLIRAQSKEWWFQLLMESSKTQRPDFACTYIESYSSYQEYGTNGCGTNLAYIYYISFYLIFSVVIMNLLMASILGAYEEFKKSEESAISKYQLNDVLQLWIKYDPQGQGFINYKNFWRLSSEIAIIFGIDPSDLLDINNKKSFLKALNIPIYEDIQSNIFCYKFHDVIVGLTRISVVIKYGVQNLEPKDPSVISQVNQAFDVKHHDYDQHFIATKFFSGDMAAIIYIQQKFRHWRQKSKLKDTLFVGDLGDIRNLLNIKSMIDLQRISSNPNGTQNESDNQLDSAQKMDCILNIILISSILKAGDQWGQEVRAIGFLKE